tara:strand:- start:559 stop:1230 length:672 start_codon:yes stop_codon:yes gene_type:complete
MNFDDYHFTKPGHIVEYFPLTQTATVQISNDRTYSTSTQDDLTVTPSYLYDVPTFTPGGGDFHMTFPIKAGDSCLLSFSQFGYDHWFVNNEDAAGVRDDGNPQPWTYRKFNLADGFCQVGWNNLKTAIDGYLADGSEWRNIDRTQRIALQENGDIEVVAGSSTLVMTKDGNVTVTAPTTAIVGDLTVSGTIVATGEVTGNGIALSTHTHAVLAADFGNTDVPS